MFYKIGNAYQGAACSAKQDYSHAQNDAISNNSLILVTNFKKRLGGRRFIFCIKIFFKKPKVQKWILTTCWSRKVKGGENISALLVGNNIDLADQRQLTKEVAKAKEVPYLETSVKIRENIEKVCSVRSYPTNSLKNMKDGHKLQNKLHKVKETERKCTIQWTGIGLWDKMRKLWEQRMRAFFPASDWAGEGEIKHPS